MRHSCIIRIMWETNVCVKTDNCFHPKVELQGVGYMHAATKPPQVCRNRPGSSSIITITKMHNSWKLDFISTYYRTTRENGPSQWEKALLKLGILSLDETIFSWLDIVNRKLPTILLNHRDNFTTW